MEPLDIALLASLILAAAVIYSSVGHAGASGYIAAMALFGLAPATMKPTALTLNILVATLATYRWHGAGLVNWKQLAPLLVTSIPAAFIGGAVQLPGVWYRILVGLVLLVAAFRLFFNHVMFRLVAMVWQRCRGCMECWQALLWGCCQG